MFRLSLAKDASVQDLWNGFVWDLRLRRGLFDREMNEWMGLFALLSNCNVNNRDDVVWWKHEGSGQF